MGALYEPTALTAELWALAKRIVSYPTPDEKREKFCHSLPVTATRTIYRTSSVRFPSALARIDLQRFVENYLQAHAPSVRKCAIISKALEKKVFHPL